MQKKKLILKTNNIIIQYVNYFLVKIYFMINLINNHYEF